MRTRVSKWSICLCFGTDDMQRGQCSWISICIAHFQTAVELGTVNNLTWIKSRVRKRTIFRKQQPVCQRKGNLQRSPRLRACVARALSFSVLTAVVKCYYLRLWGRREKLKEVAVLQRLLRYCTAYMCMCFFGSARLWRGETSVLSLGRIICGSFAAFRPGMTSHLQDVASAADPVLSGCVSRQGPASPSGPAPCLTDDNTTTLCLRELWEKKK